MICTCPAMQEDGMGHLLENPVCNALNGPHANVAVRRHRLLDGPFPPALSRKPVMVPA